MSMSYDVDGYRRNGGHIGTVGFLVDHWMQPMLFDVNGFITLERIHLDTNIKKL